jgi:hypothetical protein
MGTRFSNTNAELHALMGDIKKAASLTGIECQDDVVWRILTTFEQQFTHEPVAFRITSKSKLELNVRYQSLQPQDPYGVAVRNGLLQKTDHPVHQVMDELQEKHPEAGYFIDLGVTHGFEKVWGYFAHPLTIEEVCALDSMPISIKKRYGLFKQYGLNWVSCIGADYPSYTCNIYFLKGSYPCTPEISANIITDLGFPIPVENELAFNSEAFVFYPTFSWDSDEVLRLSFAGAGPQEAVPTNWHPLITTFAEGVPLRGPARMFTFNICYGQGIPNYYKIEADYHGDVFTVIKPLIDGVMQVMN